MSSSAPDFSSELVGDALSLGLTLLIVVRFGECPRLDEGDLSKFLGLVIDGNMDSFIAGGICFMVVGRALPLTSVSADSDVASDSARVEKLAKVYD